MPFTLDEGAFLGFACEAIIYGIYLVLFPLSIGVLVWQRKGRIDPLLTTATCLLFALCTSHFSLNFSNKWQGLITNPGIVSISDETTELFAGDIILSITDFFGQLVLIYRCWLIWSKNYLVIIFPVLLAMTAVACAMAGLGILAQTDPTAPIAPAAIAPLGTSSFALSLCLNVIVTGLVAGRIWYISRSSFEMGSTTRSRIQAIVAVLIESGALYTLVQLVFVVLFSIGHPAQNILAPVALQVYGIAPTLVIVRVGMGSTFGERSMYRSNNNTWNTSHQRPAIISVRTDHSRSNDVELKPYSPSTVSGVKIEREVIKSADWS